ncbi:MAG: DUF3891 family protein [Caldilineaceae bacterium]|nr:DUF3891 family protein [Caldilineaceae bacterium]
MVVREMEDGGLLCIPQPAHGLMAAQFCRYWGNERFARPALFDLLYAAVVLHDSGWTQWEERPALRDDGVPMDFLHHTDVAEKIAIWQQGIQVAWGHHPYAALIVTRHAAHLYAMSLKSLPFSPEERAQIAGFFEWEQALQAKARAHFRQMPELLEGMEAETLAAHTCLLQFSDNASLRLSVPWPSGSLLGCCPTGGPEGCVDIRFCYDDTTATCDPWPFGVESFAVTMTGYRLAESRFADEAAYHAALAAAPLYSQTWRVEQR